VQLTGEIVLSSVELTSPLSTPPQSETGRRTRVKIEFPLQTLQCLRLDRIDGEGRILEPNASLAELGIHHVNLGLERLDMVEQRIPLSRCSPEPLEGRAELPVVALPGNDAFRWRRLPLSNPTIQRRP
jgi:hypothetical protein